MNQQRGCFLRLPFEGFGLGVYGIRIYGVRLGFTQRSCLQFWIHCVAPVVTEGRSLRKGKIERKVQRYAIQTQWGA